MAPSVLLHETSVRLLPRLSAGTHFATRQTVYTLPKTPRADDPRPLGQSDPDAPTPGTQQAVVLVAEDEETIAETLALIVEDAGYVAVVAHDGRTALALARQHRPQLIITDLMMPYLSGADLIAALRGEAASNGMDPPAVIVVTAASRARAEAAGADAIILKPFDVRAIEAAMRRLLPDEDA